VVRNPEAAIQTLAALRDLGVSIAIDDFGIGYSSLSYLERLTVQTLKIDRSFISALGHSDSAVAIVRATIAMAHALGIQVLAEGVENATQLSILTGLGCDFGQGYYYARPLPAEDLMLAGAGPLGGPAAC
jgi:EAL domain-containing protein (putative c-di-GMP-specific phosphodiesterase class I)